MSRKALAATFGTFFAIGLLWAIAMPINAGPDEAQHMIWSASTARLQLEPSGDRVDRTLKAPSVLYADYCFKFNPNQPADCVVGTDPAGDRQNGPVGRAVPYYFLIGVPSLATSTHATAYLMRLGHIVLTSAMFTLGVWSMAAQRRTPGSIALATVAFTPMVAFLSGTVNPSGLAIAAGFAIWTAGLSWSRTAHRTWRRVAGLAIPIVVFLLVRRDALVWIVPILAIVAVHGQAIGARAERLKSAIRRPAFRVLLGICAIGAVGSYLLGGDVLLRLVRGRPAASATAGTASSAFGILPRYTEAMIGRLGWLDVFLPDPVMIGWYALVAIALLVSIGASRRDGMVSVAVLAFVLLIPYLFGVLYNDRYIQGRYALPLAIGIPLVASSAVASEGGRQLVNVRMARAIVWTVAVLSSAAFAVAVRRFTVGHRAPWPDVFLAPAWSPPIPSLILVGAYGGLMIVVALVLNGLISRCDVSDPASLSR